MTTFALVHGAWHSGACWDDLAPLLRAAGHEVVAPDLPCDDPDAGFDDYAATVVAALSSAPDDVMLVGHSLAGLTVPLVAARRPVRSLVHLCALVPSPGRTFAEQVSADPEMFVPGYWAGLEAVDDRGTTRWHDRELARSTFYGDCADDTVDRAWAQLRPQATTPYSVPCSLDRLPDVPTTYVLCADDRIVSPAWSRRVAPGVAGTVIEMPGDHSPFLSRPAELAELLLRQV